jgi:hypothetical protein
MADLPFWSRQEFWQFAEDGDVHHPSNQGIKYDHYEKLRILGLTSTKAICQELDTFKWSSKVYVLELSILLLPSDCLLASLPYLPSYIGSILFRTQSTTPSLSSDPSPLVISILSQFPFTFSCNFCLISCRSVIHPPCY